MMSALSLSMLSKINQIFEIIFGLIHLWIDKLFDVFIQEIGWELQS